MSLFQIDTGPNAPQPTPYNLALLTSSSLGLFGSRREQLSGQFLGGRSLDRPDPIRLPVHYAKSRTSPGLRLFQPVHHPHLAGHRRRGHEVLLRLLALPRTPVELAEAELAVATKGPCESWTTGASTASAAPSSGRRRSHRDPAGSCAHTRRSPSAAAACDRPCRRPA